MPLTPLLRPRVSDRKPFRFFVPILAGANLRDRVVACLGALAGIGLTGLICTIAFGSDPLLPLIVAPIGASAVLLFAVPASPLAQPWPIIGGNTISALVGIMVSHWIDDPMWAIGLAVGLAIAAMSLTRSLHPPGGASALTAVLGGPSVALAGYDFAFVPIAMNSVVLVLLGWLFHRFSSHAYPRVAAAVNVHGTADPAPAVRTGVRKEDVSAALEDLGETYDISRDDLTRLLERIELRWLMRTHVSFSCADIMSRDVISVGASADVATARALLMEHGVRTLPVVDEERRLVGTVGLRELERLQGARVCEVMTEACIEGPMAPAVGLVSVLTDGKTHAVVIIDAERNILGLVTQTDMLAVLSRMLARQE